MSNSDNKIKHLEFIQLTITRMAYNSFLIKGWLILGFVWITWIWTVLNLQVYLMIIWIISLIFWWLDAYYLTLERKFRDLYNVVRLKKEEDIDFDMGIERVYFYNILEVFKSLSLTVFYLSLILIGIWFIYLTNLQW